MKRIINNETVHISSGKRFLKRVQNAAKFSVETGPFGQRHSLHSAHSRKQEDCDSTCSRSRSRHSCRRARHDIQKRLPWWRGTFHLQNEFSTRITRTSQSYILHRWWTSRGSQSWHTAVSTGYLRRSLHNTNKTNASWKYQDCPSVRPDVSPLELLHKFQPGLNFVFETGIYTKSCRPNWFRLEAVNKQLID